MSEPNEPIDHTLVWMRRIDAKLDAMNAEMKAGFAAIDEKLSEQREEVNVASALALAATGERTGWKAMTKQIKAITKRLDALEKKA